MEMMMEKKTRLVMACKLAEPSSLDDECSFMPEDYQARPWTYCSLLLHSDTRGGFVGSRKMSLRRLGSTASRLLLEPLFRPVFKNPFPEER